jgi:hypothetical protein
MATGSNGHSAPGFETLVLKGINDLDKRVGRLEQAVIAGAAKSGAAAGRRWGTFAGGFVLALSTVLAQCDSTPPKKAEQPLPAATHTSSQCTDSGCPLRQAPKDAAE